ncbi:MAG: hypothetical protein LC640_12680, partial [Frankia sp.]|nr:hypothetical protein [Frankia sp.]
MLTVADAATGLTRPGTEPLDVAVSYDGQDLVTKTRQKKRSATSYLATVLGYDRDGNVVTREENRTEDAAGTVTRAGRSHTFTYDAADWLTTHVDSGTTTAAADDQRITTTFDATGRRASERIERNSAAWATKQTTDWTYTANGLLSTLTTKNGALPAATLASHTLSYEDPAGLYLNGHKTADAFTLAGPDATASCRVAPCTARYTYDPRERLVRADDGHGTVTDYTLDTAGNVRTETAGAVTKTYTYAGDQLATATAGGVTQNYFYDTDGNLDCVTTAAGAAADCARATGAPVSTALLADYSYDYLNRLASFASFATDGTTSTAKDSAGYTYDALDRVAAETETHGSAPARATAFDYLATSASVTNETHTVAGSPTRTKSYGYDALGARVSMTDTPTGGTAADYTYSYDSHGSVELLLNTTGAATAAYGYTPYGAADAGLTKGDTSASDPTNPFRYTARRLDSGSGTLDMGARRFGPDIGRFVQYDVLHSALGNLSLSSDPLTGNRYGLAGGNPVSFVEWDGHMAIRPDEAASECTRHCWQEIRFNRTRDENAAWQRRNKHHWYSGLASRETLNVAGRGFSNFSVGFTNTFIGVAGFHIDPFYDEDIYRPSTLVGTGTGYVEQAVGLAGLSGAASSGRGAAAAAEDAVSLSGRVRINPELGDTAIRNAGRVPGEEGVFDAIGHGTPNDLGGMSPSEVASHIRGTASWGGQDVRLL